MHLRAADAFRKHVFQSLDEFLERSLIKHSKAAAGRRNTPENVIANITNVGERSTEADMMCVLISSPKAFVEGSSQLP